jgi:hypothetical protein
VFVAVEQRSSDQCETGHGTNPKHGSDSWPSAQPARATIATASSAINNNRPLSLISEHPPLPRRKIGLQVWRSRGQRACQKNSHGYLKKLPGAPELVAAVERGAVSVSAAADALAEAKAVDEVKDIADKAVWRGSGERQGPLQPRRVHRR